MKNFDLSSSDRGPADGAEGTTLNLNYQAECLFGYPLAEIPGSSVGHDAPDRLA